MKRFGFSVLLVTCVWFLAPVSMASAMVQKVAPPSLSIAKAAAVHQVGITIGESGVAAAGPGADVTRWIEKHPYDVLQDPGERARFGQIMPEAVIGNFHKALSVASNVVRGSGYVLGEGCWPKDCGSRAAFFAIEISTGRPVAVLLFDGDMFTYGANGGTLPVALKNLVNAYKARVGY